MNTAQKRISRVGSRNEAIQHYREEYGSVFPFWVLAEVLDFADISRLFGAVTVMAHILRATSPKRTWPDKISALVQNDFLSNPMVTTSALGIPDDWRGAF